MSASSSSALPSITSTSPRTAVAPTTTSASASSSTAPSTLPWKLAQPRGAASATASSSAESCSTTRHSPSTSPREPTAFKALRCDPARLASPTARRFSPAPSLPATQASASTRSRSTHASAAPSGLSERLRLEGIAEAFNALNHRNDLIPNGAFGTGAYPTSPSPSFGRATAVRDPRQVQFALRLTY